MFHCIRNWLCVAPIFLLAGCWQKIEYTGAPTTAAKAQSSPAIAVSDPTETKRVNVSTATNTQTVTPIVADQNVTPAAEFQPVGAAPLPVATATAKPKADEDRYAIPAKDTGQPSVVEQQTLERHTDVKPVSATVDVTPRTVSPKTRRAVWILGSRLSLAALAHDRGLAVNSVPTWLDDAHSACKLLETSVPELPEPAAASDTAPASRQVVDYLLAQGQRIGLDLSRRYGPGQSALFEVALKSNILLLLYSPGSNASNSISAAISRAAPAANLPAELWKPLVDLIDKKSSPADVQAAVRQMHSDVDRYLANEAEPHGR